MGGHTDSILFIDGMLHKKLQARVIATNLERLGTGRFCSSSLVSVSVHVVFCMTMESLACSRFLDAGRYLALPCRG